MKEKNEMEDINNVIPLDVLIHIEPDTFMSKLLFRRRSIFIYPDYNDVNMAEVELEKFGVNSYREVYRAIKPEDNKVAFICCSVKKKEEPLFLEAMHAYQKRISLFDNKLIDALKIFTDEADQWIVREGAEQESD